MKTFFVVLAIMLAAACGNPTAPGCKETAVYGGGLWTVHFCGHDGQKIDCVVSNTASHFYTRDEAIQQCKREM